MDYFQRLEKETNELYDIANEARSKGLDAETFVEVPLAKDLAERVEGLVGPEGVAKRLKELEKEFDTREEVAFQITAEIASQEIEETGDKALAKREELVDQGLRTGLAILTEGVVAAPLEGIAKVGIKNNSDGSKYIAVYFAGPIRSAGGTAAALAVLLGDKIKQALNLSDYKPTSEEIERYVEEVELYESEVTNLQYSPTPEEVRTAASNIPVEVTGEATDQIEVSHKDLERVETNNIRGGALLAMIEGIVQKAKKIIKYSKILGLPGWEFLTAFTHEKPKDEDKKEDKEDKEVEEVEEEEPKYIQDIIGGRPILGYPSEKGAFRLRYGRSRNTGLATMGVNPATMELIEFLAVGTQLKIEYPGKGNCVVPVDSIEGPIIKLKNGEVLQLNTVKEAKKYKKNLDEILFLGDMLVAFGEFLRNNQPMMGASWCEEWWIETIRNSDKYDDSLNLEELEFKKLSAKEAFEISEKFDVPLHPYYTFYYNDVTVDDLNALVKWLQSSEYVEGEDLYINNSYEKRILEVLGVFHKLEDSKVIINKDIAFALMNTLTSELSKSDSTIDAVNGVSKVKIMNKAPAYIGTRVGRPEKSKERLMRPAPHVLFPINHDGGSRRLVAEAAKKGKIRTEIAMRKCPNCNFTSFASLCPKCGEPTDIGKTEERTINLRAMLRKASNNIKVRQVDEIKGVVGLMSEHKLPEPLEKGILRAKNGVFTFKEATIRHDSTDLPLTHFIPSEIGVTVDKLLEMGYTKDCYGNPITSDDQIIELKVQDIVVSINCGEYLVGVANYIDDLLEKFYGMDRFYNVEEKEDLIGHLVAGLAPHTSAGVLGRSVGFTEALGCYAHPYFHSAKRRNCDSDEDSVLLLLDALLNFSKSYLPSTRGGSMDAPLVLSTRIDPAEIDDESQKIDIMPRFPLEFFEKTQEPLKPGELLDYVDNVGMHLGQPEQYENLMFSHNTSNIHAGPHTCLYKKLNSMSDKVDAQIKLAERIRAVDQRGVVEKVLSSHFLPDIMGNVRAFSRQKVRCTSCNSKYRRIPLTGKCKCGGNLILSVSKGSVTKYLEISQDLINKYPVSHYLSQRLELQEEGIKSLFESDKSQQVNLDAFFS